MFFPIAKVTMSPYTLIFIGFTVGILGGFFGIGGAFMVTPALNIFGFPMAYAIGTDMAHITGKSIISTARHRKLGNVDLKAGFILMLGSIPGIEIGARLIMYLEKMHDIDLVVRSVYFLLLGSIGLFMLYEYRSAKRGIMAGDSFNSGLKDRIARRVQSIQIPPFVTLKHSRIEKISIWIILGVAFVTGFLASFLGVGGGFVRVPALIYLIGMPTTVAIGTDLLEIFVSGAFGSFSYALKGRVDIFAALLMLLGAAIGAQVGAVATDYVKSFKIRFYFALTIIASAVAVFLKQLGFNLGAGLLLIAAACIMSIIIIYSLIINVRKRGFVSD